MRIIQCTITLLLNPKFEILVELRMFLKLTKLERLMLLLLLTFPLVRRWSNDADNRLGLCILYLFESQGKVGYLSD